MKSERLDWIADNPFYTKRFAYFVGRRCRDTSVKAVADELNLDWHTVKELDKQYMAEQLRRVGCPTPKAVGIDEYYQTRSASVRATATASWSATCCAADRFGSAAKTDPRPAWMRSTPGWAPRNPAKSASR